MNLGEFRKMTPDETPILKEAGYPTIELGIQFPILKSSVL